MGAMSCIVLDAAHVFVCRSVIDASVDTLAGVLVREVLPQIVVLSLVHLVVVSVSLLMALFGVLTMTVTLSFLPAIVDGRTAAAMPAGSW